MKTSEMIKPIFNALTAAENLVDTGKDALHHRHRHSSRFLSPWRRNAARCTGAAALSLAFGGLALFSLLQLEKQSRKHQEWKKLDAQLDDALADSLDASDPVGKY